MKWTTANFKNPNYIENHEIYVGTKTGSFKKLTPASEEKPFAQFNLRDLNALDKGYEITSLAFGNAEQTEILIGHAQNKVQQHCLCTEQIVKEFIVETSPVVGVARYDETLIAGFGSGQVQRMSMTEEEDESDKLLISSGDHMTHMRQCTEHRNLIATGGKGRQNNLKIYDMAADGKQIFSSKNLPNDFLQLEVPVWDSDLTFIDAPHTLATCSRYGYLRVYDTRKQRRPVQCFASDEPQMSFATLTAQGNYIYSGTTMGGMKAFDIRSLKNFVHTYKGFTGAISDLCLDPSGKFLASSSLDRYVRVHHVDSCVLLYQCYVKSKATRILLRNSLERYESSIPETEKQNYEKKKLNRHEKKSNQEENESADEEYEEMFDNMQTVCDDEEDEPETPAKAGTKRKSKLKQSKNKKKKN